VSDLQVMDIPARHRFEVLGPDGQTRGFTEYDRRGSTVVFTHTEVDSADEGHGVAGTLVRGALDQVRAAGGDVVALCPYVRAWIDRHPEYRDLLHHAAQD